MVAVKLAIPVLELVWNVLFWIVWAEALPVSVSDVVGRAKFVVELPENEIAAKLVAEAILNTPAPEDELQ